MYRVKFEPYLENSHKAVMELLDYPSADTRRAAVTSVAMLCRAVWQLPARAYSLHFHLFCLHVQLSARGIQFVGCP